MIQNFKNYTSADHHVWKLLFERQQENLSNKACAAYQNALQKLAPVLRPAQIVKFDDLNELLKSNTQWEIEVVKGLIPVEDFFQLLAQRKFCSSTWLRSINQLDYLEEPDMFHDIFGHIPLLINPIFADFMQMFGEIGMQNISSPEKVLQLQRLYWFTIEFGLIQEEQKRKIYGAGILSSFGESNHVMSPTIKVKPFDIEEIMQTDFRTDEIQQLYFNLPSFEELYDQLAKHSFNTLAKSYTMFCS